MVCGATSGTDLPPFLDRLFIREIAVIGSSMGTKAELEAALDLMVSSSVRPVIDRSFPLAAATSAFEHLLARRMLGKVVVCPEG